jgi:peptide/nickel transport system substrate-binding protein
MPRALGRPAAVGCALPVRPAEDLPEQLRQIGIEIDLTLMDHSAYHAANRENLNTLNLNSSSLPLHVFNQYAPSAASMTADGKGGATYSHCGVGMPGVDDLLGHQRDLRTIGFLVVRNPRLDIGFLIEGG